MDQLVDFEEFKRFSQVHWHHIISSQNRQEKMLSSSDENVRLVAHLQTVILEAAERCFQKCISSPGTALTRREKDCLQKCTQPHAKTCELLLRLQNELES